MIFFGPVRRRRKLIPKKNKRRQLTSGSQYPGASATKLPSFLLPPSAKCCGRLCLLERRCCQRERVRCREIASSRGYLVNQNDEARTGRSCQRRLFESSPRRRVKPHRPPNSPTESFGALAAAALAEAAGEGRSIINNTIQGIVISWNLTYFFFIIITFDDTRRSRQAPCARSTG